MKKVIALFLVALALVASQASATLLTYEGFNYTAGSNIDNQNGGTGWDANWGQFLGGATTYTSVSGSLADPTATLATTGNHVDTVGTFGGRYNAFPGYGANGTTAYFSFLLRLNYTPTTNSFGGMQLFNNTGQGDLFIGKNGSGLNWGLEHTGADAYSGVAASANQTVLLVLRADYTSLNDTFRLYVNPTSSTEPGVADATLTYNIGTQNGLGLNAGGATSYDEIRIGTTFADVTPGLVPEPGTMGLVLSGLMFLGFGFRRRARRC